MRLICLFFPALIAMNSEVDEKDDIIKKLAVFAKYCIYINLIMLLILIVIGRSDVHFEDLLTVKFYFVYLLVGIISAKVLPKIIAFAKKNFNINIRRISR